ncbi:Acyl-CoA dehydrogenase, N-terminal domain [Cohaesibacter sp. ES.047]|uniref:acyl-CoA dehydrogenase n=1 Tax=Cohaesibacter sp. ES.047 TaxID=1798205 RepID=UPI000BB7BCCF|nr:acyl-CoA dehydrogenase [Cohaesibacter sp. ES.047]SNY92538.1 Acyl-CoA dehydrogenase, N-terminal domain [Cohaesibacter sp. ES.047]
MAYRAPVTDMAFTLKHVAGLSEMIAEDCYPDLSDDLIDAILEEAGRFNTEEIAPKLAMSDRHGCSLKDGVVTTPPGWKNLYHDWAEGGWNALTGPADFGGQALPLQLGTATADMWNQGSMAFAIGPTLTTGAVEAIEKHASSELKAKYLEKLVTGEWMGTMNLTEPGAGSDLNGMRTKAEPVGDGSYRISGQKIFITYGEHELTDNIIHLVLARLPDAPAGTRGISLFLVPKYPVSDDGSLGERNDVRAVGLEHKMGIHASPTCTMSFGDNGGAIGWLIGEENRGLACMFTMMNNARLMVGTQGVGIAERAFQMARDYAMDRRQGQSVGAPKGGEMEPIIVHPDVRRMLMTMAAQTEAIRSICYTCANALDRAALTDSAGDAEAAKVWSARAGILTPLAKSLSTDLGTEVASLGIQVHGGMGFIEETGAAQLLRDSRIASIYEGTNGIQAIDLVTRKLPLSEGLAVKELMAELASWASLAETGEDKSLAKVGALLAESLADLRFTTDWLQAALKEGRMEQALAGATPYQRLFGLTLGGILLLKGAMKARELGDVSADRRLAMAHFFATNLATETTALMDVVVNGAKAVLDSDALFKVE